MRVIPHMTILSPADATEAAAAVRAILDYNGPVYLRLSRLAMPVLFEAEGFSFEIGKGRVLREGSDVTIIGTGLLLHEAIKAADILTEQGVSVRLINMPTIKPIDREIIVESAKRTGAIVAVEEHSVIGGLGSAVAEVLSEEYPTPLEIVGMNDKFGCSGKPDQLLDLFEMSAPHIVKKAQRVIARKR